MLPVGGADGGAGLLLKSPADDALGAGLAEPAKSPPLARAGAGDEPPKSPALALFCGAFGEPKSPAAAGAAVGAALGAPKRPPALDGTAGFGAPNSPPALAGAGAGLGAPKSPPALAGTEGFLGWPKRSIVQRSDESEQIETARSALNKWTVRESGLRNAQPPGLAVNLLIGGRLYHEKGIALIPHNISSPRVQHATERLLKTR
jgi:hypothetical protein